PARASHAGDSRSPARPARRYGSPRGPAQLQLPARPSRPSQECLDLIEDSHCTFLLASPADRPFAQCREEDDLVVLGLEPDAGLRYVVVDEKVPVLVGELASSALE